MKLVYLLIWGSMLILGASAVWALGYLRVSDDSVRFLRTVEVT
jgi:hypothetical protein